MHSGWFYACDNIFIQLNHFDMIETIEVTYDHIEYTKLKIWSNCTYLFSPSDNADNRLSLPLSSSSVSDNFKAWKIRMKNMIIVVLFQKIALRTKRGNIKGVIE